MRNTIFIVLFLFVVVSADKNGMQKLLNNVLASSSENFDNYLCEEFKNNHGKLHSSLHKFENPRPVRKMLNLHNKNKHLEYMHRINKKHFQDPNMVTMPLDMAQIKNKHLEYEKHLQAPAMVTMPLDMAKIKDKLKKLHQADKNLRYKHAFRKIKNKHLEHEKDLSKIQPKLRDPGPAGPAGPTGPTGPAGPAGKDEIDEDFKLYTIIADVILLLLLIFGYFSLVRCFKSVNKAINTDNPNNGQLTYRPRIVREIGIIKF